MREKEASYFAFRENLRGLAERAVPRKDVWPYPFRRTALANMSRALTEAQLELYAGWVYGSKMAARYVHLSARDLEGAIHAIKSRVSFFGMLMHS